MAYLNNDIRDAIVAEATKRAGFPAREEAICRKASEWVEDVRAFVLPLPEKELLKLEAGLVKALDKFPEDCRPAWRLHRDDDLRVKILGEFQTLYFSKSPTDDPFHFVPSSRSENRLVFQIGRHVAINEPGLVKRYEAIMAERRKFRNDRDILGTEVRGAMAGARTIEKLLKQWPESEALLPKTSKPTSTALTVPLDDLNAKLKLP